MEMKREARPEVSLGIANETVYAGDHIAYFYESDEEFERAFGFVEMGLRGQEHCVIFGIDEDIERSLAVMERRGWRPAELIAAGRMSTLNPSATCDETVEIVSSHFQRIYDSGTRFIRFIGNAAVGREGWPSEEEFYRLEATVSAATLRMPCVAICMFDLRAQPARTIMKGAFEGHPVTLHRNCIRENPYYVPRAEAGAREAGLVV
jgi:hypothetical protein